MSDERTREFGEEGFGGGEQVREGEEIEQVGDEEEFRTENEEFGENDFSESEEFGAENVESYSVENDRETVSVSSSNRRIKEMSIDRLSALPDSLLIRILTKLDMKEAATTAVLSKRWQFIWTELPRLEFQERSMETQKIREFVTRIHRTLVMRSGNYLEKFEVDFRYDECFALDVSVWVEFAVKNKVKKVNLMLDSYGDFYTLPQMMYSNSSLTELSVRGCFMAPRRTIEWQSLTSLDIGEVELPQHVLEKIISGCPVLCSLCLDECWGFNCLELNSLSLCSLSVLDCEDGNSEPLLKISAPHVRYLDVSLYPKGRKLQLTNIPSVVTAYIRFCGCDYDSSSVEVMSNAKELFESILHVEELELGCQYFEVLSKLVVNGWQLPQSRVRSLMVNASRDEHSFCGIVGLLESSSDLETLIIMSEGFSEESVTWGPAARGDLNCDLVHLKTVDIIDYAKLSGEPMLTMAQILLKRATTLEKMVVDVKSLTKFCSASTSDISKIAQILLGYPRSSQKAAVVLHQ